MTSSSGVASPDGGGGPDGHGDTAWWGSVAGGMDEKCRGHQLGMIDGRFIQDRCQLD